MKSGTSRRNGKLTRVRMLVADKTLQAVRLEKEAQEVLKLYRKKSIRPLQVLAMPWLGWRAVVTSSLTIQVLENYCKLMWMVAFLFLLEKT